MESYSEQIAEVFINPIRSVLIIDDRFPTLDSLLNNSVKEVPEKPRLSALLAFCRDSKRQWLVDVHDGAGLGNVADLSYSCLRQCDLLILDYNLDGDIMDGSKAVEVLRQLGESNNFNLAIVYTSQPTDEVFNEIALTFAEDLNKLSVRKSELKSVEDALDMAEDSDPEIRLKIRKIVTLQLCVQFLANGVSTQNPKNKALLEPLIALLPPEAFDTPQLKDALVRMFLVDLISKRAKGTTFPIVLSDPTTPSKWLIAGNVFVAVVSKDVTPTDLIARLTKSLEEWMPSPNRLIFAKLRAVLEASGLGTENRLFQDRTLQAFWLHKLLETIEIERPHYIAALLDRQMEVMTDFLRDKVVEFTQRVVATSLATGDSSIVLTERFWKIDPTTTSKQVLGMISHNTHVSTKERCGKNLVPGHILKLGPSDNDLWICLSPACDLEAGRENSGRDFKKNVYPWMPFTALRLYHMPDTEAALAHATRGWVLFLTIGGKKKQFSFFKEGDPNKSPVWEEFLAAAQGRITESFELDIARLKKEKTKDGPPDEHVLPSYKNQKITIVAQVRSEYAVSLALRLTSHLSRIGLDYVSRNVEVVECNLETPSLAADTVN